MGQIEIVDLYDFARRKTGRTMARGESTPEGCYRLVVLAWLRNPRGELLLTRRDLQRDWRPGYWEVPGGGAQAGEDSRAAIAREVAEETGIAVDATKGALLCSTRERDAFFDGWLFDVPDIPCEALTLQPGEVMDAQWASRQRYEELRRAGTFVPETPDFYQLQPERALSGMNRRVVEDITRFLFLSDEPDAADVILIPGSAQPGPSERAAELYRAGYAGRILPSGRWSILKGVFAGVKERRELYPGPYETEWAFMRDVLVRGGVPPETILCEDRATTTYDNAAFSADVLRGQGLAPQRAIICCKAHHARRCLMYYQLYLPYTEFLFCPVETQGVRRGDWYLDACATQTVLGELERCGSQFAALLRPELFGCSEGGFVFSVGMGSFAPSGATNLSLAKEKGWIKRLPGAAAPGTPLHVGSIFNAAPDRSSPLLLYQQGASNSFALPDGRFAPTCRKIHKVSWVSDSRHMD